ncbi:MAG: response regulator transcription factor [Thermoleophilia bacterium]|nr:response regulator transcription factor [Thermoleophilia bacterium]
MTTEERIVTVGIADDHPAIREALKLVLGFAPGFRVVGEATDGRGAVALVEGDARPDLLLVDLNMPEMDELSVLRHIRTTYPEVTIVIHSGEDEAQARRKFAHADEYEYVMKGDSRNLVERLQQIAARRATSLDGPPPVSERWPAGAALPRLDSNQQPFD